MMSNSIAQNWVYGIIRVKIRITVSSSLEGPTHRKTDRPFSLRLQMEGRLADLGSVCPKMKHKAADLRSVSQSSLGHYRSNEPLGRGVYQLASDQQILKCTAVDLNAKADLIAVCRKMDREAADLRSVSSQIENAGADHNPQKVSKWADLKSVHFKMMCKAADLRTVSPQAEQVPATAREVKQVYFISEFSNAQNSCGMLMSLKME